MLPCDIAAGGAMVMPAFGSVKTCQLSGYDILTGPCCSCLKLPLGFTCCMLTFVICPVPPLPLWPLWSLGAGGRFAGTAPCSLFCRAHVPCLAPAAISCAV